MGPRRARRRGMVAGAAIATSRNNKNQAAAAQAATPVPQEAPASTEDSIEQVKQLAELKDQGILTQEEFDVKKKEILGL